MAAQVGTTRARPGRAAPARARTIDLATLYRENFSEEIPKQQDASKQRLLSWTRQRAENAGLKKNFKLVGIAPIPRPGAKTSTAKLNTSWRMIDAVKRWKTDPDIIYIPNVYEDTFIKHFPNSYTGEVVRDSTVPIWIAGPQDAIQENLIHQRVLPEDANQSAYDDWFNEVAITVDNYANKAQYAELVALDKQAAKSKVTWQTADVARIDGILWLTETLATRPGVVQILDVNRAYIGDYGEELQKAPTNVFTDWILKAISKGIDLENTTIVISGLTSGTDAKIGRSKTVLSNEDIAAGKYGSLKRRPLNVEIVVTVTTDSGARESYTIPRNSIWTAGLKPISALFAEIEAVNKAKGSKVRYEISASGRDVRSQVESLLKEIKKRDDGEEAPQKTQKQRPFNAGLVYK